MKLSRGSIYLQPLDFTRMLKIFIGEEDSIMLKKLAIYLWEIKTCSFSPKPSPSILNGIKKLILEENSRRVGSTHHDISSGKDFLNMIPITPGKGQ